MAHELDQILISLSQPDFDKRLRDFFFSKAGMAYFGFGELHIDKNRKVADILNDVAKHGDAAISKFIKSKDATGRDNEVKKFTKEFDNVELMPGQFRVSVEDLKRAHSEIDKALLCSIQKAIENVRKYQTEIFIGNKPDILEHSGIRYTPIKRIGICVPGAAAPLPSTVIMTAVPAQVAGVNEIVVVSPPRYNKDIHPVTLGVCYELGIDEVYRIGGAQAVAALAFGTGKIREVDKIVGPGNQWVQTAKHLVSADVGIDFMAGPSEVLIIANERANPGWVAADMLSQAEHDPGCAFLFTDSQELAEKVLNELKEQVKHLCRAKETSDCLKKFSGIAIFGDMDDLIQRANEFAAEHLQIQCGDKSREIAGRIENAGAIFIGDYSPVAVGDYWAGPSNTLPTGISALFASALSANDFIKSTSIIEYDKKRLAESAEDIIRLAEVEGLDAHAKSIKIRQQD